MCVIFKIAIIKLNCGAISWNLPNNTLLFLVIIIVPKNRNLYLEQYFSIKSEIMEKSIKCFKQMGLIQTAKISMLNNFI